MYTQYFLHAVISKNRTVPFRDTYIYIHEQRSFSPFSNDPTIFDEMASTTTFDFSKDDDARDRAYSLAIGSAFASHPFLIRRITKRARVTGAREQVANASSFIARAKRIVSKRAGRARRLDALRLVGPPWKSISNSPRNPVLSRKVNYIRRGELVEELAGGEKNGRNSLKPWIVSAKHSVKRLAKH